MRLQCWYCHKPVSSELPKDAIFRAIAVCPECVENSSEANKHPLIQPGIDKIKDEVLRRVRKLDKTFTSQYEGAVTEWLVRTVIEVANAS